MKRIILTLLIIPLHLFGQGDIYFSPVFDVSEVKTGLQSISQNDLRAHITFLSSDPLEGRETGEKGLQIAAEYIASQFRRLGLTSLNPDGSYFQKYELLKIKFKSDPQFSLIYQEGSSTVKEIFSYREDYFSSSRGIVNGLEVKAPLVFAGYGITAPEYEYDDYANVDVASKIVLIIDGEPDISEDTFKGDEDTHHSDIREKLKRAKEKKVAALLVASNPKKGEIFSDKYKRWRRWLRRETMLLPSSEKSVPLFIISSRTADRILANTGNSLRDLQTELENDGKSNAQELPDRYVHFILEIEKTSIITQNVAGLFPGVDPEVGHETIVISAHYDHLGVDDKGSIWHGADDNGTGTSAVLEIAEAIVWNTTPPKRSFLFLAVSGEEKGLLGSKFYTTQPLLPLDNTITDLNIDMIGRNAPDSVYIIGSNMISEDLHEINEYASGKIDNLFLNYLYNSLDDPNRFYYRSDHYNFAQYGIPIIFYFAGVHKDYHKPTDTADKIDYAKTEKIARLVYLTGWGISQNDVRPRINAGEYPEIPDRIKY
ncbi:MAG: M28 family peptidase [Candidatus Marinimicrobia bacterium]|nr:M28 family peptidase [Candidatus Neomarinimicrobiota bacterium]